MAADDLGVAFELAHNRAGVNMLDAGHAHPFGDDAERNGVVLLPGIGPVPRTVQMPDHIIPAGTISPSTG